MIYRVKIRVELMDSTIVPLTEVLMPIAHKKFEDYGIVGEVDPGFDTPVHALAKYLMDYCGISPEEMSAMLDIRRANLVKICGVYADGTYGGSSKHYWMYMINDEYPYYKGSPYGYNMAAYPLKDGDTITIYAMEYLKTEYYGFFQQYQFHIKQGEEVNLTLSGRSVMGGIDFPIYGALISCDSGSMILDNISTDSQGKASIIFPSSGTYVLSAKKIDISRSYAQITVIR